MHQTAHPNPAPERRFLRSGRFVGLFDTHILPVAVETRLIVWVMVTAGLTCLVSAVGGRIIYGEIHPLAWPAAGAFVWSGTFITFRRRPLSVLVLGVAATMTIAQAVTRDPRIFPVTLMAIVVGTMVAYPFSPPGMRTPVMVLAIAGALSLIPTGGDDVMSATILAMVAAASVGVGYRLLAGLEGAIEEAESDRSAMLEVVERAPIVGMMLDCSEIVEHLDGIGPADLSQRASSDIGFIDRALQKGRITWMNEASRQSFGIADVTEDVLLGRDIVSSEPEAAVDLLAALAEGRRYLAMTAEAPTADGESRWFHANWVLPPERLDRCFVVATDVTDVIAARRHLEQHIDDKNRFLATISHELRTPLTAVLGFAREAREVSDGIGGQPAWEFLDLVIDQAEEMSFIIDDLLTAVRADAGSLAIETRLIDVDDLARRLAAASRAPVEVREEAAYRRWQIRCGFDRFSAISSATPCDTGDSRVRSQSPGSTIWWRWRSRTMVRRCLPTWSSRSSNPTSPPTSL